jgi:hypothetical protein
MSTVWWCMSCGIVRDDGSIVCVSTGGACPAVYGCMGVWVDEYSVWVYVARPVRLEGRSTVWKSKVEGRGKY